ncbi:MULTISPECIES: DUF6230 family protein [unclassified Kitasatospora]|uniref:DUF6230 family protein n=1 Tax=unclassified Kitasatospora TaxID=2633591 RepID=UPI002E30C28A|nr:DUF6230 family protein [Kitasatospora sp. NBC_01246]
MSQTYGKTRWKRFALVMVPSLAATAAVGVALANNALAASFSVSGQSFKVTTAELHGSNFAQFGSIDAETNGTPHPVAISAFDSATIKSLCQSVVTDPNVIPGLPWKLPKITLRLEAGQSDDPAKQVTAKNLLIDLEQLNADAEFTNINIGQDASTLKGTATQGWKSKLGTGLPSGATGFAQAADKADLSNVQQTAWATSAGTFKLQGLKLNLHTDGGHECY